MTVDWGLIKVQWELFGATAEELAAEFNTTPRMIQLAADTNDWRRLPISEKVQDWQQLEDLDHITVLEEAQSRQNILKFLREYTLSPKYIALEAALLDRALSVLKHIAADDPNGPSKIKTVSEVLKSLKEATYGKVVEQAGNSAGSGNITLNILNKVEPKSESEAIEISFPEVQQLPPADV